MAHSNRSIAVLLGALTMGLVGNVQAGQWDVVINGRSVHIDADEQWNEDNWGLGFEHEFNPESRWVRVALGSGFRDSDDHMSYMGGGGIKRRFRVPLGERRFHFDAGVVGFVMTRHDVNKNRPFPGILPAFSVGTSRFALNLTYLPGHVAERVARARTADPDLDGIVFLQLKINSRLFGLGARRTAEGSRLAGAD